MAEVENRWKKYFPVMLNRDDDRKVDVTWLVSVWRLGFVKKKYNRIN